MKNTFSFFSQRNVVLAFMLTGFFFLLGMNNASAQLATAKGNSNNPYTSIAQSFGVTAYPLGHFDQAEVIEALDGIMAPIKPLLGHGASQAQKLKYEYVSAVLNDVNQDVAVEISLLTRLEKLKDSKNITIPNNVTKSNPTQQLAALYNEIVNELQ